MEAVTLNMFTAAECKEIVENALQDKDIEVKSFSVKRGSNDLVGFMGEYYILHVIVNDKARGDQQIQKLRFFVKTVPLTNEYHKDECERKNFFEKETYIYTKILPNLQKYAPKKLFPRCYYTRRDLLVLEDLTSAGFRHLGSNEPYTPVHHKLMLAHLAQLHASSIAYEANEECINNDKLFEMLLTTKNEWYVAGAKGIVFLAKRYPKFQTPQIQKLVNERLLDILTNVDHYTAPSKKCRNVFCHRDSWDRNIFFKFAGEQPIDCCIVDFQLSRYSPPALDVLFFLYGSTTAAQRENNMKEYLEHYYTSLQTCLRNLNLSEDTITRAQFDENCHSMLLPVLIIWGICKPLTMMPEGLSNKLRSEEQEKFDHYMNVERDEFFLRVMEIDPTYESKIMWPIEEMIEYLLKKDVTDAN